MLKRLTDEFMKNEQAKKSLFNITKRISNDFDQEEMDEIDRDVSQILKSVEKVVLDENFRFPKIFNSKPISNLECPTDESSDVYSNQLLDSTTY